MSPNPGMTRDDATLAARTFIVPEDMGTPPGALSLRGATNFQTPPGWDTVYTPIFNMIDRPVAPMLVVRVETDWYAHETEFRYVLEPGEGISGSHTMPIGQVVFVPREEISFRDCTEAELDAIKESAAQFSRDKAAARVSTPYGMPYSPHYLKQSRGRSRNRKSGQSVDTFFQFLIRCSAVRQASACAVSVGLRAPLVPITDAPSTPRFGTSCEKPQRLTTLVSGLSPMRVPP